MHELARELVSRWQAGEVVMLKGELGSGKTTFVQGVAKALGVDELVTSPTFVLQTRYAVPDHDTIRELVHVDLYRLGPQDAVSESVIEETMGRDRGDALVMVEWPERLGRRKVPHAHELLFAHGAGESERVVSVCK
jgi:tRNA threonylcarbamoyladenosine biosynthesis protein TsaE